MGFKNELDRLTHLVSGLEILDEEHAQDFTANLLMNLSINVEKGLWSEDKHPDAFDYLWMLLRRNKDWYIMHRPLMGEVESLRQDWPKDHWWWWIEEL